jgi:AAA+ ATPase superfamily predicted ATPase
VPRINPFKPNSPVPTAMFAGRIKEIQALEQGLHQAKNGFPENFLITGERGIGKSSLMSLLQPMASGDITTLDDHKFNFVTVNVEVSSKMGLATFIKLIERNIKREIGEIEKFRKFLDNTWSFVQRIQIMDSGINKSENTEEIDLVIDDFSHSLSKTCNRITNPEKDEVSKDGIVFFIDESDNASADLHIGYFFKVVTEQLQRHGCNNIMFIVAGLPDIIEKLAQSHESSIRIFNPLIIRELKTDDRRYVVERGLAAGNEINTEHTTISDDAKDLISTLSEGYPHFIQQFAHSAFAYNSDGEISKDDVGQAAFCEGGALDAIGSRYYQGPYNEQIKSDDYREVLTIMADNLNSWIKKSEITEKFSGNDYTVTDALKALTERKIIIKNAAKRGEYRLQQRGFAIWIKLFGQRKK